MDKFRAVIFDQDGVLLHLLPFFSAAHAAVINICLQEMTGETDRIFTDKNSIYLNSAICGATYKIKLAETAKLHGVSGIEQFANNSFYDDLQEQLLDVFLESGEEAVKSLPHGERLLAYLQKDDVLHNGLVHIETFLGVEAALKSLKENNVTMAVASTNPPHRVRNALRAANLLQYFDPNNIFGAGGENIRGKPAPDVYLAAIAKLENTPVAELTPEICKRYIAIEDSISGVQAACAAGMLTLGVFQDEMKKSGMGPDTINSEMFNLNAAGARTVFSDFSGIKSELHWAFDLHEKTVETYVPSNTPI